MVGCVARGGIVGVCNSKAFGGQTPTMILATITVENVDRFLEVFSTKVADKRALYGSKGATVFRDPTEKNRIWGVFDMAEAGWAKFGSDPRVPSLIQQNCAHAQNIAMQ